MVDITGVADLDNLGFEGPSLRRHRLAAGLTQAEVAEAMGVSQAAVSKWEAANDPGDVWPRLAAVLGVREPYPSAPFEPVARRAWFDARNASMRATPPPSGIFGSGKPPQEAA